MKNLFTLLFLASATAMGWAQSMPTNTMYAPQDQQSTGQMRAESQKFNIQFCGNDIGGWTGYTPDQGKTVMAYIYIDADQATKMAGNKITGLTMSIVTGSTQDITAKGTAFVSEDLNAEPVCKVNMTYKNAYFLDGYKQTAQFARSKQYEIKENTPFWFGYTVDFGADNEFLMLGFDKLMASDDHSGVVKIIREDGTGDSFSGKEIFKGEDGMYHNLFLYAMSEGTPLDTDQFSIGAFKIGSWSTPTFDKQNIMPMKVEIDNTGTKAITSIEYTYWFANDPTVHSNVAELNIVGGSKQWAELPINYPEGRNSVSVSINKVNDTALKVLGNGSFFYLGEKGYPGKFIVEKFTGSKCGFCPSGIYAFEYMEYHHSEDFVPIEMMNYHSSEPYYCMTYGPIASWCSGAPNCIINRHPNYRGITINYHVLENAYYLWKGQMSNGEIALEVEYGNTIDVKSHTTFAVDDDHTYRIAYVLCENQLPGTQINNYSGSNQDIAGDWGSKGTKVSWIYNNVAREIKDALGLYDSTINAPRGGNTYDCSVSFDKRALYASNPATAYICALLIDATTGELVTASTSALVPGGTSTVGSIENENSTAEYYTVDGMRVAEPKSGNMYIRVANGKATKIIR